MEITVQVVGSCWSLRPPCLMDFDPRQRLVDRRGKTIQCNEGNGCICWVFFVSILLTPFYICMVDALHLWTSNCVWKYSDERNTHCKPIFQRNKSSVNALYRCAYQSMDDLSHTNTERALFVKTCRQAAGWSRSSTFCLKQQCSMYDMKNSGGALSSDLRDQS